MSWRQDRATFPARAAVLGLWLRAAIEELVQMTATETII